MNNPVETFDTPLHTIAWCLNEVIVNNDHDIALQNVVNNLFEIYQVDRCYVLSSDTYIRNRMYVAYGRHAHITSAIVGDFPEAEQVLCQNQPVKALANGEESLQKWMQYEDVTSMLLVPVFLNGSFWGAVGFADTKNTRTWKRCESQLFSLGSAIGAATQSQLVKKSLEREAETDLRRLKKTEQTLLETERKFHFIAENLSDFISIHDTDWNFTYASPSVVNILGYQPEEILGLGSFDLVDPDDLLRIVTTSLQPLVIEKKEVKYRYRMLRKNGKYQWVETYSKPVINSDNEITSIISSTRDVTEQVNAEISLKESEAKYRLLSENSNDVIGIHSLGGEFLYVSPSCTKVFGHNPADLMGKTPATILLLGDDAKRIAQESLQSVIKEGVATKFIAPISTGLNELKQVEMWLIPIFKGQQVVNIQSATRDVTEREQLLNDLEQSLAKERELNELRAKFVSTASHQFRTPLTVIQSGVEIMEIYLEDLPAQKQVKFRRQFNKIQEEVYRLEHLMDDVLLLGRANAARTPFNPVKDSLVTFCTTIIEDKYNHRYDENRRVQLSVKGVEIPVFFDPKLLAHALENILSNAYKYSQKGNILLAIAFTNDAVTISVTDQGIGIPPDDIKNLFEPFYRATNTSDIEGTGLGLSIAKEFVEKHRGKIFLTSEVHKSTTINVILPVD